MSTTRQPRYYTGAKAQEIIKQRFEHLYNDKFEFISMAQPASKLPDLVIKLHERPLQLEVKGRDTANSNITFFDKSIRRGETSNTLNKLCSIFTHERYADFEQMMDSYRNVTPAIGFPGDVGTPKSGKLPQILKATNAHDISNQVREMLVSHFFDHQDNYFAVITHKIAGQIEIYHTGFGENPLNAPLFPQLSHVMLGTLGGSYKGSMRVAIKGRLDTPGLLI